LILHFHLSFFIGRFLFQSAELGLQDHPGQSQDEPLGALTDYMQTRVSHFPQTQHIHACEQSQYQERWVLACRADRYS
jgi:hypothetical protein